jgi:AmiR/NasT family two-component response regulator
VPYDSPTDPGVFTVQVGIAHFLRLPSAKMRVSLKEQTTTMTSALLCVTRPMTAPTLLADLQAAGVSVCATQSDATKLVRDVALHAPDVLICDVPMPGSSWFAAIHLLGQAVPCPILVFTNDMDAGNICKSVESGIHVYVPHGYSGQRLRALIQLAQARFSQAQTQRKAFDDLATRLEERIAVDRAKGILMRDQNLSDDDAFRVLRSMAMRSNQRLGQLSQHVIQSAHDAEAMNRSGQLRMLSQRLVKLHWLKCAMTANAEPVALLQASVQRVDDNISYLRSHLSAPTFADLLDPIARSWEALKSALDQDLPTDVDAHAQALLEGAERLTSSLEISGNAPPLRLLNLAGRQRMLSQRYAMCTLQSLSAPGNAAQGAAAGMLAAQREFESALTFLNSLPLSSPAIQNTLRDAGVAWLRLVSAAKALARADQSQRDQPLAALASESESLLQLFEQLAAQYAHSLDMLVG